MPSEHEVDRMQTRLTPRQQRWGIPRMDRKQALAVWCQRSKQPASGVRRQVLLCKLWQPLQHKPATGILAAVTHF